MNGLFKISIGLVLFTVIQLYLIAFNVFTFSYDDSNGTRYAVNIAIFLELFFAVVFAAVEIVLQTNKED